MCIIIRDDLIQGVEIEDYRLLSDLHGMHGMTLLEYQPRADGNYAASVDAACGAIERLVAEHGPYEDPRETLERKRSLLHFCLRSSWRELCGRTRSCCRPSFI